jgi:hypothetical protein
LLAKEMVDRQIGRRSWSTHPAAYPTISTARTSIVPNCICGHVEAVSTAVS